MDKKKTAALGGDGIGPELVDVACDLLEHAGFNLETIKPPNGEAVVEKLGTAFPEETKKLCSDGLFERIIREEVAKHPELSYDQYLAVTSGLGPFHSI